MKQESSKKAHRQQNDFLRCLRNFTYTGKLPTSWNDIHQKLNGNQSYSFNKIPIYCEKFVLAKKNSLGKVISINPNESFVPAQKALNAFSNVLSVDSKARNEKLLCFLHRLNSSF